MSAAPQHSIPENLKSFVWAVGVECSILPHIQVDQFEWTQHRQRWRDDFRLIKDELAGPVVRYCLPWSLVEPQRGKFDWGWADERIDYITGELGLTLYLDVMHFGCPQWLPLAVGDPEFPEALENLATRLVERYRDRVHVFCPFNEPLITALFSGDFGFWPPHTRRWRGYMPVLSRVVQATLRATRAIRNAAPEATVLLCDSCEHHQTAEEQLKSDVQLRNLRRFTVLDLITGQVDAKHPLYTWLCAYGFTETDLAWIRANRWAPDVIGLDYYSHTETQLETMPAGIRQKKPDRPLGLYGCAMQYWSRYGIPLMLTETSIEGAALSRETWLEQTVNDCRRLRSEGVPLLGYTWWPFFDNVDWDGALLHHIGKIHGVGLYNLRRQKDGALKRVRSPLADQFAELVRGGDTSVGEVAELSTPALDLGAETYDPIPLANSEAQYKFTLREAPPPPAASADPAAAPARLSNRLRAAATSSGRHRGISQRLRSSARPSGNGDSQPAPLPRDARARALAPAHDNWGMVVFCHLRWGFVWQRPQQFVSRYAKKHPVLFIEEPMFDLKEGSPRLFMHRVMPNVVVACPHFPEKGADPATIPADLERFARQAIGVLNDEGQFSAPVLYYYNPMDVSWSLGKFNERAVVYDCMDELCNFKNAPKALLDNETRLLEAADLVFTGGYQMYLSKSARNSNCHFFGCGVDVAHFAQALSDDTPVPPDIDFMARPILGWFGVIDERVDYPLLDKLAEIHHDWSIAMVGPIVKVDPNLLPHRPNLFWLGGRDYQILPNYCRAFDACLMPFAINDATKYINPTKALEYMATGRPIVSTAIADVIRNFGEIVKIAHSHQAFIAACEEVLAHPNQVSLDKGRELAAQNSWNSIVAKMLALLDQAVERRAASPVAQPTAPRLQTDTGILEIAWSYPSVAGS